MTDPELRAAYRAALIDFFRRSREGWTATDHANNLECARLYDLNPDLCDDVDDEISDELRANNNNLNAL